VELLESLGEWTAEDIVAPWNLPSCDNAAMDGYACPRDDCRQPPSCGYRLFGLPEPWLPLRSMRAARSDHDRSAYISGGDTVVPVRDTEECGNQVQITRRWFGPEYRLVGEDVRCGETVIAAGRVIRAAEIGIAGFMRPGVVLGSSEPAVGHLSTGMKLLGSRGTTGPWQSCRQQRNVVSCRHPGVWRDAGDAWDCSRQPASHAQKMSEGLKADAFITSAGVIRRRRDFGAGGLLN